MAHQSMADMRREWNETRRLTGFRSQYEVDISEHLPPEAEYEKHRLTYSFTQTCHYTPDWILPEQCLVIEAKGRFTLEDRTKMLIVKQAYPDLTFCLLLQKPSERLTKAMTAADWCKAHGFPYAKGTKIPDEWLNHIPTPKERKAFCRAFGLDSYTELLQ